jgi:hypothetical protein
LLQTVLPPYNIPKALPLFLLYGEIDFPYRATGYMVGSAGLARSLVIIGVANLISVLTSVSLSAIATNLKVKRGGDHYLISRTLGLEFGGAIGIVLFLAQAVSIAFYCIGFGEAEIAAILSLATLAGIIGIKLRQPLIIMFLATGILAGPSFLGIIHSYEQIEMLAHIGIALLLFIVGLKLDLNLIHHLLMDVSKTPKSCSPVARDTPLLRVRGAM